MIDWIRSSGLTQEEAALIQPGYPVGGVTGFEDLAAPGATLEQNGFVVSELTQRTHLFDTTLPTNFRDDPSALQAFFEFAKAELEANGSDGSLFFPNASGISFGSQLFIDHPENLDESLYIGTNHTGIDNFPFVTNSSSDAAIVEVDYKIRSEQSDFSQIALTSNGQDINFGTVLLVSQIYDGDTGELLGENQLTEIGLEFLFESRTDSIPVATDFVRIKSYVLVVDQLTFDGPSSFFHEFSITPTILGDCDQDGVLTLFDIAPFVATLASGSYLAEADIDQNSDVTFADIIPFIEVLSGQ